ncbi:MAG: TonB-dependent receptor [Halioglobus sp.]
MTPTSVCKRNPLAAAIIAATVSTFSINAAAQLEEVIVTAQKRAESAQDVPIAITAFDTEALEAKQIVGFADMRFTAPSVSYTKGNFTGSNFAIRGVGSNLVATSADAGVGIHVNEVPILSPRLFETEYYDIEQLAVLRGPQGTLYGRNSTGGAVNMETAKASTDEMFGNIEGQYGDYDHTKVVGHVNIPVSDTLAVRLAGIYLERDGYSDNIFTGNDFDGRDQYSMRGSVKWLPGENTSVDLMVSYFDEDSSRSRSQKTQCDYDPVGVLGCLPTDKLDFDLPNTSATLATILSSTAILGPVGAFDLGSFDPLTTPRDLRKVESERDPTYEADETLVTLNIAHEFDNYTLSFVGGYQDTEVFSSMDYQWSVSDSIEVNPLLELVVPNTYAALYSDGCFPQSASSGNPTGVIGGFVDTCRDSFEAFDESRAATEQYSGEIRLQSDFDGAFNFLVGGFYMESETDSDYWVVATGLDYFASLGAGVDGVGLVSPAFNSETDEYNITSTAFFGEVYYDITDTLKLTVGARYTIDEKDVNARSPLLSAGAQVIGANDLVTKPYDFQEDEWKETTGRVVLDWAMSDDTLAYASFSRGYKGGGFNPPFEKSEFPDQAETFEPEFVDSFEIGVKNQLLDNTLQANLSAFFYDYSDMQISKIVNRTSFNENTDAEIYGAEAEFVWAPDANWLFNANFSYVHSEVQDFNSVDARDPAAGRDPLINSLSGFDAPAPGTEVTTIKSLDNASNCVVLLDPATYGVLTGSDPNNRYSACGALEAAGLPVVGGIEQDLDGNQLQNSPEWSYSLGGQYTWVMPSAAELTVRVDYYWQDEIYTRLYNRPVDTVDDWDVWNAQLTFTSSDARWYARAYGKNLADEDNVVGHYFTDASSGNFTNVFAIEPRTYGLALGYNF